jgi:hypothetical protein
MSKLFEGTAEQVEGMLTVLEQRWPGAAARLAHDPFSEIGSWGDLTIAPVPEEDNVPDGSKRGCSVAGGYLWQTKPRHLLSQSPSQLAANASPCCTNSDTTSRAPTSNSETS